MTWQQAQLKYVTRFNYGDALPSVDEERRGLIKVFGSNGPYSYYSEANTKAPTIVIGRKGSYGKVNWSDEPVFASDTTFFVDTTTTQHHLRWLFYVLQTLNLDEGSNEAAVPGLNRDNAYQKEVLVPSLPEQRAIAAYLDRTTTKLDALIAAKERLLDLLAEKRRALISHVVTHGLNSDAPLRDSGVEWLGEIPAHWGASRIAFLFRERDERNRPDLPLLNVSIHTGVSIREFSDDHIEQMAADPSIYKVAYKGDIAFNKMRMWQGAVGRVPIDGLVSPDYVVAAPIAEIETAYYGELFRIGAFSAEAARYSHGIVWDRLRLYWQEFRDIWVPVPPLHEQREIISYIAQATAKLDQLYSATERTIELLHERRAALIAAAVSGKIRVTDSYAA